MVEWLFLAVPLGCLRFVIVVFPDHTHLLLLLLSLFVGSTDSVLTSYAIISQRKREHVA